jgi:predicted aldo/keto reductase-like oxidoreductase
MEYRTLGKTGLKVSSTGLGTEYLTNQSEKTIADVLHTAVEADFSYIDLLWDNPDWWSNFEPVFGQYRNLFAVAAHWGGDLNRMDLCQQYFDGILSRLCNEYAEVGLVAIVDTDVKWEGSAQDALSRLQRYKRQGRIGAIGASSHRASVALKMVRSEQIDVLMYPVNLLNHSSEENRMLCQACGEHNVGLVAMKPYAGGQIFIKTPPITPAQCIAYVLSQPISTTVIGVKNAEELRAALHYWEADEEEKSFLSVLENIRQYLVGDCVYCNHCLPCPQDIDIGSMIQMADTAQFFPLDEIMAEYASIPARASACTECGECMERCPFDVDVVAKMRTAVDFFEKRI